MWGRLVWCKKKKEKKRRKLRIRVRSSRLPVGGEGTRDWVDGAAFFKYPVEITRLVRLLHPFCHYFAFR
jgi:hypothetical protein